MVKVHTKCITDLDKLNLVWWLILPSFLLQLKSKPNCWFWLLTCLLFIWSSRQTTTLWKKFKLLTKKTKISFWIHIFSGFKPRTLHSFNFFLKKSYLSTLLIILMGWWEDNEITIVKNEERIGFEKANTNFTDFENYLQCQCWYPRVCYVLD